MCLESKIDFECENQTSDCNINMQNNSDYNAELIKIIKKKKKYHSLWRMFSISNKLLMLINFISILLSIFVTEGNITLALSIFTLSFSFICDTRIYIPILNQIIIVYTDEIIPEIKKIIRDYENGIIQQNIDVVDMIIKKEKELLRYFLGASFTITNTLRGLDWKKVICIGFVYVIFFVGIALLCYYKQKGLI